MVRSSELFECINKTSNKENVSLAKRDGKDVLLVKFPKGSAAPHGSPKGGFVAYHPCDGFPAKWASIAFDIFIDSKFEWNKGGKLPWGFYMGERGASGGRHSADGGTVRIMWRRDGAAEAYLYLPKGTKQSPELDKEPGIVRDANFGMSLWRGSFKLERGACNKIALSVGLNDVGKQNGSISLTINGKTETFNKLMWRTQDTMLISGLMGAAFFGGNDSSWASPVNTFIEVSDVDLKTRS